MCQVRPTPSRSLSSTRMTSSLCRASFSAVLQTGSSLTWRLLEWYRAGQWPQHDQLTCRDSVVHNCLDSVFAPHPRQSNFQPTVCDTVDHFFCWCCSCHWKCRAPHALHTSVREYVSSALVLASLHAQSTVQKSVSRSRWAI